jgi:heme exporter protein A
MALGCMSLVLDLHGIVHRFQASYVLRGANLALPARQILALYGANGAGKTTLLKIIASSVAATRGSGTILGFDLRQRFQIRQRVQLVSHSLGFYPDLTGLENLEFALTMHGKTADIVAALDRVGLNTQNRVRGYSSGMRKRLALAKMLLLQPDLILLDEPFAALDPSGKNLVEQLILEQQSRGATIIVASHEPERTNQLATSIATLEQGLLHISEVPKQ